MKLGIDPDQVKGFLEKQEAEALFQFAKKYSSIGPCLEIGSYCGKSAVYLGCLFYTSPSPRDKRQSRMPSSA